MAVDFYSGWRNKVPDNTGVFVFDKKKKNHTANLGPGDISPAVEKFPAAAFDFCLIRILKTGNQNRPS